jgi:hypothetical protein
MMARKGWRESGWEPETIEDAELVAQVENGVPIGLIDEAAKAQAAREEYEARQAIRRLPKAYEKHVSQEKPHELTPFLMDIDRMSYQGMSPQQIAGRLGISVIVLAEMARKYLTVYWCLVGGAARATDEHSALATYASLRGDVDMTKWILEVKHQFNPPQIAPQVNINTGEGSVNLSFDRATALSDAQSEVLKLLESEEEDANVVDVEAEEVEKSDGEGEILVDSGDE